MTSLRSAGNALRICSRSHVAPLVSSRAFPFRSIHAFTPSPSLLKKNRGSALETEEFEEDVIEEDDSSLRSATDPLPPPSAESTLSARRSEIYEALSAETAKSAYYLRSNKPSTKTLTALIQTSATAEEMESTIEQIALIRRKVVGAITSGILETLVSRCLAIKLPEKVVDVLEDRTTYGLDLDSIRTSQRIAWALGTKVSYGGPPTEELKEVVYEKAIKMLKLSRFYLPTASDDPTLLLFTIRMADKTGGMEKEDIKAIVEEIKQMGEDTIMESVTMKAEERGPNNRLVPLSRIYARVRGAVDGARVYYQEREGKSEEMAFFASLHTRLVDAEPTKATV